MNGDHPRQPAQPLCTWGGHTCGGCCNDFSQGRQQLARLLRRRARLFPAEQATDPEALACFRRTLDYLEGTKDCKFLAFLDESQERGHERVGCLIHPRRHGGVELREVSPFGAGLCDYSYCPPAGAFDPGRVDPFLAWLARGADWYDYSRLFARFVFDGQESGLYQLLSARTRPLADLLLRRGLNSEPGLALYARLLSRLLGLSVGQVFEPEGIRRLSEVADLPAAALEREVAAWGEQGGTPPP